jgi:hypothetical protein
MGDACGNRDKEKQIRQQTVMGIPAATETKKRRIACSRQYVRSKTETRKSRRTADSR